MLHPVIDQLFEREDFVRTPNFAKALMQEVPGLGALADAARENLPFPAVPQSRFKKGSPDDKSGEVQMQIFQAIQRTRLCESRSALMITLQEMLATAQCREHIANILKGFSNSIGAIRTIAEETSDLRFSRGVASELGLPHELVREIMERAMDMFAHSPLYSRLAKFAENRDIMLLLAVGLFGSTPEIFNSFRMEDGDDSAFIIMGNVIEGRHKLPGVQGTDLDVDHRNHPGMMNRQKLLHFLQLPRIREWLREEMDPERPPESLATTMAIAAECYAEVKELMEANDVTEADVEKWIERKLALYDPSYHTSLYLFGRLMWSQFSGVAIRKVAPHLRRKVVEQCPTIQVAAADGDEQNFFILFEQAVTRVTQDPNATFIQVAELLCVTPFSNQTKDIPRGELETRFNLSHARKWRERLVKKMTEVVAHMTFADLMQAMDKPARILPEIHLSKNNIEGFPHFDQMALGQMIAQMAIDIMGRLTDVADRLLRACSMDELRIFGRAIGKSQMFMINLIGQLFKRVYLERIGRQFVAEETDQGLVGISEATGPGDTGVQRVVTATMADLAAMGLDPTGVQPNAIAGAAAESELLHRYLHNTREGQGLIRYLMQHRELMRTPELVLPFPDAVNPEVIKEFADHPDLFALLQITTVLQYRGHRGKVVLDEVRFHAEKSQKLHHPEMEAIGVELEQANPEGRIVNPSYAWLLNVMVRGNDWDTSHEITTAPTSSPYLQTILLALISKPEFGFMDTGKVWNEQDQGIPSSSIHASLSVGREFDSMGVDVDRILAPLSNALYLAHSHQIKFRRNDPRSAAIPMGSIGRNLGHWKWNGSILDAHDRLSGHHRLEEKSGALSRRGAHEDVIEAVWALGNAGMHHFRNTRGTFVSGTGFSQRLTEVYDRFLADLRVAFDAQRPLGDVGASELGSQSAQLQALLRHHTQAVMAEVGQSVTLADATGRIIRPYRAETNRVITYA